MSYLSIIDDLIYHTGCSYKDVEQELEISKNDYCNTLNKLLLPNKKIKLNHDPLSFWDGEDIVINNNIPEVSAFIWSYPICKN
tara:strand:+ start:6398 stop:6646 length:249 start_codon:yes stop_codon:yes gene_type:complete